MAIDPTAMGNAGIGIGTAIGGPIGGAIGGMVGGLAGDLYNTYVSPTPPVMPDFAYPNHTQMLDSCLQSAMAQTNSFWAFATANRKALGEHLPDAHLTRLENGLKEFRIARKQLVLKHGAKARAANPIEMAAPGAKFPVELVDEVKNWRHKAMGTFNTWSKPIKTYGRELNVLTLRHGGIGGLKNALKGQRENAMALSGVFDWLNKAVEAAPTVIGIVDKGFDIYNSLSSFFKK